jgi:hypothetical protein
MAYTNPNIATSAATWAQLQAGGMSNLLERLVTVNGAGTVAPTVAPTLAESGSAGTLAATTYYVVCTETNGIGETTAGPVSSGLAITSTGEIVVTFPTLKTGNTARNTYVGLAALGPWYLAATGTTAATVTIGSLPTNSYAVQPPLINSTAFEFVDTNGNTVNAALQAVRAAERGNLQPIYNQAAKIVDDFLRGDPMSFMGTIHGLHRLHTGFAIIAQAFADAGTLIDANAGTLGHATATGIGGSQTLRTWP